MATKPASSEGKPATSESKSSKAKPTSSEPPQSAKGNPNRRIGGEDTWEYRKYSSRRWGHTLKETSGGNTRAVKKLTNTLKDARSKSETALRRTAVEALVPASTIGNRGALAAQATALGDPDKVVRRVAVKALQTAGGKKVESGGAVSVALAEALPQFTKSDNAEIRRGAASSLVRLNPQPDKALAKLAFKWMDDDDHLVRASASEAMGLVGSQPAHLDALKRSLTDKNWKVSQSAVEGLKNLTMEKKKKAADDDSGGSAPNTGESPNNSRPGSSATNWEMTKGLISASTPAEALAECCRSNLLRGLPRADAVKALGKVAKEGDKSAILVCASQLTDVDAQVRRAAVGALKALAPGDRTGAIRATASQLTHSDYRARGAAADALTAVSGKTDIQESAFILAASALETEDWRGRRGVGKALSKLGKISDEARANVFAVLIPRLEHPDWSIRRKAAQALGEVAEGEGDERAVKLLASLARDPNEEVREAVVLALPGAAPPRKCKVAITMASTFCRDPNPMIRMAACNALELLAAPNRSRSRVAVHAVAACVKDEEEEVRLTAERVMRSIANGRRTAIDDLTERLQDPDEGVRIAAAEAFGGVGGANKDRALKRAVPLLRHHDPGVREAASLALQGMLGPEEAAAVAAGASAVAKFRRRYEGPAGYANSDFDPDSEPESLDEEVEEVHHVHQTEKQVAHAAAHVSMAEALMAGDMKRATLIDMGDRLHQAEEEVVPEEVIIKEDTDTESELSESGTEIDSEEEEEQQFDADGHPIAHVHHEHGHGHHGHGHGGHHGH